MARHLVVGNGKMLVNLDEHSSIRDLYYPYVGQLNHVGGHRCRIGVWTEQGFSWLDDRTWQIKLSYRQESLVTEVTASNDRIGIQLQIHDAVHQREAIFLRHIEMTNLLASQRTVRLFFSQDLTINETEVGDTAAYYPDNHSLFHYKKDKYFMFNTMSGEQGIYEYTTGVKRFQHAEGTWKDAEDGHLMGNPIAQGSVDSTFSVQVLLPPSGQTDAYYWFSVAKSLHEVIKLDAYVKDSHPGKLLERVHIYWNHWVNKNDRDNGDLSPALTALYKHSLLIARTQINLNGAITAANDTDILAYNRDHYSYMWPRDGALIACAMSSAGYQGMIVPFFHFCANVISEEGYLYHKYNPDGTIGSSWHPYIRAGRAQLPIQEDETALVLFALWEDYVNHGVIELPQSLYRSFIRKSAAFLTTYLEPDLDLPKASYDLWEERYGIFTFTSATVYGGIRAAANFCDLFGDWERARQYEEVAARIKAAILKHLWDEKSGRFARGLTWREGKWTKDMTLESSTFGIFKFGVLAADDVRVVQTMHSIKEGLACQTSVGGIARYMNDHYFQVSKEIDRIPGNPWVICTLWVAEWEIACAQTLADLKSPRRTLEWVAEQALESGVLPEQLNPYDGSPLSVAPLTWSHATFVLTMDKYLAKYRELRTSP